MGQNSYSCWLPYGNAHASEEVYFGIHLNAILTVSKFALKKFQEITSTLRMQLSWPSSGPEFCAVWLRKMPASGWGSLWESSSFFPWFVPYAFPDASGAVPEWPWISRFMRKSSRRDRAPKMRFFVLLNSWDNFFVILPSISWETWVM